LGASWDGMRRRCRVAPYPFLIGVMLGARKQSTAITLRDSSCRRVTVVRGGEGSDVELRPTVPTKVEKTK